MLDNLPFIGCLTQGSGRVLTNRKDQFPELYGWMVKLSTVCVFHPHLTLISINWSSRFYCPVENSPPFLQLPSILITRLQPCVPCDTVTLLQVSADTSIRVSCRCSSLSPSCPHTLLSPIIVLSRHVVQNIQASQTCHFIAEENKTDKDHSLDFRVLDIPHLMCTVTHHLQTFLPIFTCSLEYEDLFMKLSFVRHPVYFQQLSPASVEVMFRTEYTPHYFIYYHIVHI